MKHRKTCSLPAFPLSSCSAPQSPILSSTSEEPRFIELLARSNFSFLQGASHPEEMVLHARKLGYQGLAICDVNGLYGVVRGYQAIEKPSTFDSEQILDASNSTATALSFRYLCGSELTPHDASSVTVLPMNKDGYIALCQLVTKGKRGAPKGYFSLSLGELCAANENLIAFPQPPWRQEANGSWPEIERLQEAFQDRIYLPVQRDFTWESIQLYQQALAIEQATGIPLFATQKPLFHVSDRKPIHDILTCILHKTTLTEATTRLTLNRERHLKTPHQLAELFRDRPDLIERTLTIADRVDFSLRELKYKYPREHLPKDKTANEHLREQVEKGLLWRYPPTTPPEILVQARDLAEKELAVIGQLEFEDYFLTLWDVCQFARACGILHQGRGSAANSIVCFTLGLTSADPVRMGLMFERFISLRRREPPDIDIDFEHERREEIIRYIYDKYGENHAAMVCTVIRYRSRMAVREVAKVLGITFEQITALVKFMGREGISRLIDVIGNVPQTTTAETRLDLRKIDLDLHRFTLLVRMAQELMGFPRHLGIHSGGFVIAHEPVTHIVPVEAATKDGRFVVQWNKDDISTLGMMKIDILSLGMLTAIRKAFDLLRNHKNIDIDMATTPHDDLPTYHMIQKADTIGVFQIESRAQMSLLPRLKPACFYDLVIEVAIVRPGPIQGGMVHPFLRRRSGQEKVTFAHPCLTPFLKKTLGIPLFQEQVMQIAVAAAGFSPDESDDLRRIMSSAWRKKAVMGNIHQRVVSGMLTRGISRTYAEQIYKTIEGFSSYGFPESHAISFALITYISCYLKHHYPDVFCCALLNSQPMGFYSPRQLIADAQRHGIQFQPLDVQHSAWDYTLEGPGPSPQSIRVGLRSVYGMREAHAQLLADERIRGGPFLGLSDLVHRTRLPRATWIRLAATGALNSFGLNPREALWALQGMIFDDKSLFFAESASLDSERLNLEFGQLPVENSWENVQREYQTKGFAIDSHPLSVLRPWLARSNRPYLTAQQLEKCPHLAKVKIAGLMSLLQRPPTAKGMCFLSLEDETGLMNIVISPDLYQRTRLVLINSPLLEIEGTLESREGVRNIRAKDIRALEPTKGQLTPHTSQITGMP